MGSRETQDVELMSEDTAKELIGILHDLNNRTVKVAELFREVCKRMTKIEKRLDKIEAKCNARLDNIEAQLINKMW